MNKLLTTLELAAANYGTDKLAHGYLPFYAEHLPANPKKILEIGVKEGASIRMWRDVFPDSELHGLDLFQEFQVPDIDGVKFWAGNQADHELLEQLRKEDFDVIIDDGSHNSRDQLITFFGLFNGKHYFIEDVHCCKEAFYRDGLPFTATIANLIFQDTGRGAIQEYTHGNGIEDGIILFKQKIFNTTCS